MIKTAKAKTTEFRLSAPQAKRVSLAGTFNNWDTASLSAKKDAKGSWTVKVDLRPGRYEYKFFVDGSWMNDPSCRGCISNSFGSQNCIMEVK